MTPRMRARRVLAHCSAVLVGAALTASGANAGETIAYSYDALGQLVKVARTGTVNNNTSACYSYDPASNRSNVTVSTTSECGAVTAPTFSISDASVAEGGTAAFTVTRSGSTTGSYTVNYATASGTAVAGGDYNSASGTLTFAAGVTSQQIQVTSLQDVSVEGNETFNVNLSAASDGATISDSQGVGTIVDDDTAPICGGVSFTIASNGAVTEGAGSIFTITKTGSTSASCSVNYASGDGTAAAGSDYSAASGTLTFTSAQTSQTVTVATTDDAASESAETFSMALSSPTGGAVVGTPASANATINDNDGAPATCSSVSFSVSDTSGIEADPLGFTVTKTGSTSISCSVNYATADGTAVAPGDYTAKSGTLAFTSAQTTLTVNVTTNSNQILAEPDETVLLNLSVPTDGATITDSQGVGTIIDDGLGGGGGNCPRACN